MLDRRCIFLPRPRPLSPFRRLNGGTLFGSPRFALSIQALDFAGQRPRRVVGWLLILKDGAFPFGHGLINGPGLPTGGGVALTSLKRGYVQKRESAQKSASDYSRTPAP